ncbi:MAG TPA: GspH/FimT family pseudopilin [Rubrivivax sp.]|nr:GspH/FimT family pseudopilin [Rubrivivax sp.]
MKGSSLARTPEQRGFTLVELLIVVSLVAVVLGLAGPSFTSFIQMQRLKSINAQLVTDLQSARSEAVGRNVPVYVRFGEAANMSCYVLYTTTSMPPAHCDCLTGTCASGATKIRATEVPADSAVTVSARTLNAFDHFSFDPRTGGMVVRMDDGRPVTPDEYLIDVSLDAARKLRDKVGPTGRVAVCKPAGSTMTNPGC